VLHCDPSRLDLSVSGECQMGEVPAEDTLMLKSVKRVFVTQGVYSNNDVPFFLECALFILF